ncbi:Uncharacterized protein HSRCO_0405 [Halanaeroarchaeum sp. HSR-CO]|uniref:DUF5806 family protein n=1 Tax=Halanaeroarchaeum sp. HSR-CO TaxID=2866382 RepID=UPI00217E2C72|nr:DUF5806 family protein [Halanaeroarchaeum sp. HSR-CO]UWG46702.1 Uncharacterized protein HSRCO_0405 [Halanaeroarchaeum sp. HSR-CO]
MPADEQPAADPAGPGDESTGRAADEPPDAAEDVEPGDADASPPDSAPDGAEDATASDEYTDPGGQAVAEPPAGRPEVAVDSAADTPTDDGAVASTDEAAASPSGDAEAVESDVPPDVRKYDRFKKVDGAQYDRVNDFLRDRTYITAREWAIARLCSDFRTETGVEMTKIGENLPYLVPFMTDTYTPQAVNQARSSFEEKVRKAGATFLYGAMSDFFTADELDEVMYEVTEVAKFLLEVEGVDLAVDEELDSEERISSVMREVRQASDELRYEGTTCPNCGHEIGGADHEAHTGE